MSKCTPNTKCRRRLHNVLSAVVVIAGLAVVAVKSASSGDDPPKKYDLMRGAELFAREWLPGDSKGPGGDGLGPVYNETSCVACHHQGGPGGAGPTSTNVEIVTTPSAMRNEDRPVDLHPGFQTSQSIVLHRYGVDPEYTRKRLTLLFGQQVAQMAESVETEIAQVIEAGLQSGARGSARIENGLVLSQRNAPALFGVGKLDAISEETLLDAAMTKKIRRFPRNRGPCQPPQGWPYRPLRLEGRDAQPPRVRSLCLCQRARSGGPRPPPGRLAARARRNRQRPGLDAARV